MKEPKPKRGAPRHRPHAWFNDSDVFVKLAVGKGACPRSLNEPPNRQQKHRASPPLAFPIVPPATQGRWRAALAQMSLAFPIVPPATQGRWRAPLAQMSLAFPIVPPATQGRWRAPLALRCLPDRELESYGDFWQSRVGLRGKFPAVYCRDALADRSARAFATISLISFISVGP